MKIGNIIASIGIVLSVIGFISLPLTDPFHQWHHYVPGNPAGAGWKTIILTGIFIRPGIILLGLGILLFLIAKCLPRKYWKQPYE